MNLAEKESRIEAELGRFKNSQDRFAWLVSQAKVATSRETLIRTEKHLVPGCLAKLWWQEEYKEGRCFFTGDSESLIVKGIAGMLADFYSGQLPQEILSHPPDFLKPLGITQHLTPNRRDALARIWKRIQEFAALHKSPETTQTAGVKPGDTVQPT